MELLVRVHVLTADNAAVVVPLVDSGVQFTQLLAVQFYLFGFHHHHGFYFLFLHPCYNRYYRTEVIKIDWTTFISSGLLSTIISLVVTEWNTSKKVNSELRGRSLLLYEEINNQLYRLNVQSDLCIELLLSTPDTEWNKSKYFLADNLSFEQFQVIHSHYRSMKAAREILKREGHIPQPFINEYLAKADAALSVLLSLAKLDMQKLEAYNKQISE